MPAFRHRTSVDRAVITQLPVSPADELAHRRRRYLLMMSGRIVGCIVAVPLAQVSIWLALTVIAASAVLPWCAVLLANDAPPKRRSAATIGVAPYKERQLGSDGES